MTIVLDFPLKICYNSCMNDKLNRGNPNLSPTKTDPDNRFRNDNNNLYARELFVEFNTKPEVCLYTLKDHDYRGYPSLKRLYLEDRDVTEYLFATRYFDGWNHWEQLAKTAWLSPYVAQWRNELALLLEAEQIDRLIATSAGTSKEAFAAQKYLADKFGRKVITRGRPSKEEVSRVAKEMALETSTLEEEAQRVFGKPN
jgi:hypothetical protein